MKYIKYLFCSAVLFTGITALGQNSNSSDPVLKLPTGFKQSLIARDLGVARHLAVHPNGDIYVKLDRVKNSGGIVKLSDKNKDGVFETSSFGDYAGTGIAIKNGYLYATSNSTIYRYKFNSNNEIENPSNPEVIVSGLIDKRQHNSKSITLDNAGNVYVNVGAPSNSCQEQDRQNGSMGMDPCPILDSAAGIWKFSTSKQNQTYGDGKRYITGTRNVVGLDWNDQINELFVMQHGRDQLAQMWSEYYTPKQGDELPAEEMFLAKEGMNFGWPYCYYDPFQNKKVLAPEYGGDGKKVGRCAEMQDPVVAFPAHMAPDGLLFYTGSQFPARYKNGAFIAFHGSWNRSVDGQEGYFVAFVPFQNGRPSGKWEVFASGFAAVPKVVSTRDAKYRPCGLAQAPDGSLYITDDNKGMVWRITYNK